MTTPITPGRYQMRSIGIAEVGCAKSLRPGMIAGEVGILWVHWNPETGEQVPVNSGSRDSGFDLIRRVGDLNAESE